MSHSYTALYVLAVAVAVILAGLAAIQVADPDLLGLTRKHLAWAGVASAMLGVLASFLPRVNKPPSESRRGMD